MADTHIIRVIVQGYNRLSGVLNDAVNKSAPALDKLNNKFNKNRTEANKASSAVDNFRNQVMGGDSVLNRAGQTIDNFGDKVRELEAQFKKTGETASDMFDRLKREGRQPRERPGFSPFLSKEKFVEQENERRASAAAQRLADIRREADELVLGVRQAWEKVNLESAHQAALAEEAERNRFLNRVRAQKNRLFHGFGPFDELRDGFRQGLARPERESVVDRIRFEMEEKLSDLRKEELKETEKIRNENRKRLSDARVAALEEENRLRRVQRARDEEIDKIRTKIKLEQELYENQRKADLSTELASIRNLKKDDEGKKITPAARKELQTEARDRSDTDISREAASAKKRLDDLEVTRSEVHRKIALDIKEDERTRIDSANNYNRTELSNISERFGAERRAVREEHQNRKENLAEVISLERAARKERFSGIDNFAERNAARAGAVVGDLGAGFRGAKKGLKEFEGDALRAQSAVSRFGASVGNAVRDVNTFVNIRWLFLVGILQTFLTLAIQLGAALVAIGSSAVVAAAALGGAFVAGVMQAIPVVGLLAAAMHQLENALKVLQLRQKAKDSADVDSQARAEAMKNANDQLINSHHNLKAAIEGVGDAERGIRDAHTTVTEALNDQRDAVAGLATARQQAARAIVDANLAEKASAIDLKDAEIGVLEAKKKLKDFDDAQRRNKADLQEAEAAVREAQARLGLARTQGDVAEIAAANSALATARGNVDTIKDQLAEIQTTHAGLVNDVKKSEQAVDEARVKRTRAQQDAGTRRKQGVEGSPEVRGAQDTLRNANLTYARSIEGVADAERRHRDAVYQVSAAHRALVSSQDAVTKASDKTSAAQRNADREFGKLSKSEQAFVVGAEKLRDKYKQVIRPITDILVDAVTRGMGRATELLDDPKIIASLTNLAGKIADVGDSFSKWVVSPEGRKTINDTLDHAAENLPIIAKAAGEFALALVDIGNAASPILTRLLTGVEHLSKRFKEATGDSKGLSDFFSNAGKHLDAWENLAGSVFKLLGALVGASAGEGLKSVNGIAGAFDDLADKINKNPEPVRKFFEQVRQSLSHLLPILGNFILKLIRAVTSPEFQNFTTFVLETMLPALLTMIGILGKVAGALDFLTHLPLVGPFVKWAIQLLIVTGLLKKLFPVLKGVLGLVGIKRFLIVGALYLLLTHLDKVEAALKKVKEWFDKLPKSLQVVVAILGGGAAGAGMIGVLALLIGHYGKLATAILKVGGRAGALENLALTLTGAGGKRGILGLMGKAGLAGAALLAGIEIGKLLLKIGPLRRAMTRLGESAADLVTKHPLDRKILGALGVETGSEKGRALEGHDDPKTVTTVQGEYRRLRKAGVTDQVAKSRISRRHPNLGDDAIDALIPSSWADRKRTEFRAGGVVSSTKRGEALKGYDQMIVPVLASYRQFKHDFGSHDLAMAGLKSQYPSIPMNALNAMIPSSYVARRFAKGGMVDIARRVGGFAVGGARVAADSVHAMLSPGEVVLTDDGQRRIERTAPGLLRSVVKSQLPHFRTGGVVQEFVGGGIVKGIKKAAKKTADFLNPLPVYKKGVRSAAGKLLSREEWNALMEYPGARAAGETAPFLASAVGAGRTLRRGAQRGAKRIQSVTGDQVFYHGTKAVFGRFQKRAANEEGLYGPGFYFTSDRKIANSYATGEHIGKNTRSFYGPRGVFHDEREIDEYLEDHPNRLLLHKEHVMYNYDQLGRQVPASVKGSRREPRIAADFLDTTTERPNVRMARLRVTKPFDIDRRFSEEDIDHIANAVRQRAPRMGKIKHRGSGPQGLLYELNRLKRFATDKGIGARGTNENLYDIMAAEIGKRNTARVLEGAGFDAIKYPGGRMLGGTEHDVYVVFNNKQVKTPFAKARKKVAKFVGGGIVGGIGKAGHWLRKKEEKVAKHVWRDPKPGTHSGMGLGSYLKGTAKSLDPRTPEGALSLASTVVGGKSGRAGRGERPIGVRAMNRLEKLHAGRDWRPPPAPLGTGKAVSKAASTARGNVGESVFARVIGGKVTSGKGEGKGGHGDFDVALANQRFEVKTMTVESQKYQASPRRLATGELETFKKEDAARRQGVKPNLAYVVVDPRSGRAYIYSRQGLSYARLGAKGSETGWRYHGFKQLTKEELVPFGGKRKKFRMGGIVGAVQGAVQGTAHAVKNKMDSLSAWHKNRVQRIYQKGLTDAPGTVTHDIQVRNLVRAGLTHEQAFWVAEQSRQKYLHPQPEGGRIGMKSGLPGNEKLPWWAAREGGIVPSKKRGEYLKGYENLIVPVQNAYRSFRHEMFPHKEALASLKLQWPTVPFNALQSMIPPSYEKRQFKKGGVVREYANAGEVEGQGAGRAVPAIVHVGEWILNKTQQLKLAQKLGTTVEAAKIMLFGSKGASPKTGTVSGKKTKPDGQTSKGHGFELFPQKDSDGNRVNFLRMADGTWAQVTQKDATRITSSNGAWMPGYINRRNKASHIARHFGTAQQAFASGGVVSYSPSSTNSVPSSGITSPQTTPPAPIHKTNDIDFNVKVEGDTDWNYAMRLAAQVAQESL